MNYESPEWISLRDSKLLEWFHGNQSAVEFVKCIGHIAEVWDDLIDKDKEISDYSINKAFWECLISLPNNEFFHHNVNFFTPLMIGWITAWTDSVKLEKGGYQERAYALTLRDMYVQIVPMCVFLISGREESQQVSLEAWDFFTKHEDAEKWINNKIK